MKIKREVKVEIKVLDEQLINSLFKTIKALNLQVIQLTKLLKQKNARS